MNGIRCLQRHEVAVNVRLTVHRGNVGDLEAAAQLLLEELGLPDFSTNSVCYLGLCRHDAGSLQLTASERTQAMTTLQRLSRKYPGRIQAAAGPLAEVTLWRSMLQASREGALPAAGEGCLSSCGVGRDKIAVRADGAFVPCVQLGHLVLGQIGKDRLAQVWRHSPTLARLRRRSERSLHEFDFCRGCELIDHCRGGCPGSAYSEFGEVDHPSSDGCFRRFVEGGGALPALEEGC